MGIRWAANTDYKIADVVSPILARDFCVGGDSGGILFIVSFVCVLARDDSAVFGNGEGADYFIDSAFGTEGTVGCD